MRPWFRWTLVGLAVASAALGFYAYHRYFPRNGSTPDRAIIVPADLGDREVSWEMTQARRFYPDADLGDAIQGLVPYKGRLLDAYEFHTSSGKQINVFFDIGPDTKP